MPQCADNYMRFCTFIKKIISLPLMKPTDVVKHAGNWVVGHHFVEITICSHGLCGVHLY